MESNFIEYLQNTIHYKKAGNGPAVVLLHGLGETGECWINQIPTILSSGFRLIIPDLPGSGRSTWKNDKELTIEEMAMMIRQIFQEEKIHQPAILGHSMGGYVALKYMQLYPNETSALGLIHSTAYADTEEKKAIRNKSISFIETNGIAAYLPTSLNGLFKEENRALADVLMNQAGTISGATIIQYHRAIMARKEQTDTLKNCSIPVLIISGKYDNAVPFADSLAQSYLAPVTDFHALKQSAHMGHWEEAEQVNKILVDFLTRD